MTKHPMPSTSGGSMKDRWSARTKKLAQKIKNTYAQMVHAIKRGDRTLDAFEDDFKGKSTRGKLKLVFVIAAAATIMPGGYIILELWAAKKAAKWVTQKFGYHPPPNE